jgi:photolyase PhrII
MSSSSSSSSAPTPVPAPALDAAAAAAHAQLESAVAAADSALTLAALRSLLALPMTPGVLRAMPLARTVGKLRKSADTEVAGLATAAVTQWKDMLAAPAPPLATFLAGDAPAPAPADGSDGPAAAPSFFDLNRERVLRAAPAPAPPNVVYWMSRDQRVADNWALIRAQQLAAASSGGLCIVFCLASSFLGGAYARHFGFMLRGLKETESRANALNIPFHIVCGAPEDVLPAFAAANGVGTIVCDFSPLRHARQSRVALAAALAASGGAGAGLREVDAHNVAPCFRVSDKCEFAARTIRPKIHAAMNTYLTEFPAVEKHPFSFPAAAPAYAPVSGGGARARAEMWAAVAGAVLPRLDASVGEVHWAAPGEAAAAKAMRHFLPRLNTTYAGARNDPCDDSGASNLSPYFHFGHLAVQRVLLEIKRGYQCGTGALFPSASRTSGIHSFCEEAVVRKELSDNFCNYNPDYDSIDGAHK